MIISLYHFDHVPAEVARLNEPRTAREQFEWYVSQENIFGYRNFAVDRNEFSKQWSTWRDEMRSELFLMSTALTYRIRYILGSLCCHLCRKPIVTVQDDPREYLVENQNRLRLDFIARYPTQYFAAYFCLANYNLATKTTLARSPKPGIEPLETLCQTYQNDPERARNVISDLHQFVMLHRVL